MNDNSCRYFICPDIHRFDTFAEGLFQDKPSAFCAESTRSECLKLCRPQRIIESGNLQSIHYGQAQQNLGRRRIWPFASGHWRHLYFQSLQNTGYAGRRQWRRIHAEFPRTHQRRHCAGSQPVSHEHIPETTLGKRHARDRDHHHHPGLCLGGALFAGMVLKPQPHIP